MERCTTDRTFLLQLISGHALGGRFRAGLVTARGTSRAPGALVCRGGTCCRTLLHSENDILGRDPLGLVPVPVL